MKRFPLFATSCVGIAALAGFIGLATAAYAQTFTKFDVPNTTSTRLNHQPGRDFIVQLNLTLEGGGVPRQ